jgi:drug/metabolite transporter (DMT)-like permease
VTVHRSTNAGIGAGVASAAMFGTSGTLATSLLRTGWSPAAAVTARLVVAAAVLAGPALVQLRGQWSLLRRGWWPVGLYGLVAVAGAQLCYFQAVDRLSVAVALLLEYSGILLVVAWTWLRHRHAPGWLTAAGGGAALVGLALVLDLFGRQHLDPLGVLWGVGAAVGLAVFYVMSAGTDDPLPPLVTAWGGLVVGAVGMGAVVATGVLPFAAHRGQVVIGHQRLSWLVPVLALGVVAAAAAYVLGIVAARLVGARLASFVGLAEVLCASVYAWVLLGEALSPGQMAGGLLVVAGIVLVRLDPKALPAPRPQAPEADLALGAVR